MKAHKLWRRLLPLALLGTALALCAVKLLEMWPQRLHLRLLPQEQAMTRGERLGVVVSRRNQPDSPLATVWFTLDSDARSRSLEHTFKLSRGEYRFRVVLELVDGTRKQWQIYRVVSGDGEWVLPLDETLP